MTPPPDLVLDASALLAAPRGEPGGAQVEPHIERGVMSSVNWAEVVQRSSASGIPLEGFRDDLEAVGLTISPFTDDDAETTAMLWTRTRALGLSLGDRACLALALRLGLPALTADRVWEQLDVGVEVRVVR